MFWKEFQIDMLPHRCWQGIAHPKNSNPFPASFLNFKATLRLAPILIPGRQTFIDWTMDFMTETHAVAYMRESMNSIMRVALLSKHSSQQSPVMKAYWTPYKMYRRTTYDDNKDTK